MIKVKKEKSTNDLLEEINKKLEKILCILATQGKNTDTQIKILKKAGFTSEETGLFVGLTDAAVRKRKSWSQG